MKWYHWLGIGTGVLIIGSYINRARVMSDLSKIKLGKYFTLDEFVNTSTGIENIPPQSAIDALTKLVTYVLDPLRERIGLPYTITSGYRSPAVNALTTGASKTSQHPKGEAADGKFIFPSKTKAEVLALIKPKGFNESNIEWDEMKDCYKLTNQTIIDTLRKYRIPYDQAIDEERTAIGGKSKWVHLSYDADGTQRTQWLTRRDTGIGTPDIYTTVKFGYA